MIYVSSNLEDDVEISMCGGNDLKMTVRYSIKRREPANSNIGLLISKLYHSILKPPNMFILDQMTTLPAVGDCQELHYLQRR